MKQSKVRRSGILSHLPLVAIGLVCAALICWCIHDGHEWGGDFALYIEQSQAIGSGQVDELYSANKYAMDHSEYEVGPYLYPFGFPVLLWPVLKIAGIHFVALKAFCGLFLLLSIPLLAVLFRSRLGSSWLVYVVIAVVCWHAGYVTFADNVLSDLPFFFFALLALVFMERSPTAANQIGLGVVMFYAYFIRDMGIVLLGALAVYQLIRWMGDRKTYSGQWVQSLPYIVFVVLFSVVKWTLPDGGENHVRKLKENFSGEMILKNVQDYSTLFEDYFFVSEAVWYVLLALIIVGMVSGWRTHAHFIVWIVGCLMIILIWPHFQGVRFVFPVVPFVVFFIVKGLWFVLEKIPVSPRLRLAIPVLLASYVVVRTMIDVQSYHKKDSNQAWTGETREWYAFISSHVRSDEVVGFEKPRVLRLFTGVTAILSTPDHFAESEADLLFVHKFYLPVAGDEYVIERETEHFYLLRRK